MFHSPFLNPHFNPSPPTPSCLVLPNPCSKEREGSSYSGWDHSSICTWGFGVLGEEGVKKEEGEGEEVVIYGVLPLN